MLRGIKKEERKFIVYAHTNTISGEIFYIGIGKAGREKQKYKRSKRWFAYVEKYGYKSEILFTNFNWYEACEKEKELINKIGRKDNNAGPLINMTDGGDGAVGQVGYWKGRKNLLLSERNKGNRYGAGKDGARGMTPEVIERIKKGRLGKPPWNKGLKGKKWSPEQMAKRLKWLTGRKHSEETKMKMSLAQKGKPKIKKAA